MLLVIAMSARIFNSPSVNLEGFSFSWTAGSVVFLSSEVFDEVVDDVDVSVVDDDVDVGVDVKLSLRFFDCGINSVNFLIVAATRSTSYSSF